MIRKEYVIGAKDDTGRATRSASQNFDMLEGKVRDFGQTLLGAVGVGAFATYIRNAITAGDEMNKLAKTIGTSVEVLSQYDHLAKAVGVDFDIIATSMREATRRISEAATGTGKAKDEIFELHLSAERLNKLRPEQQFEVLADAINGVVNPADRLRIATQLFGDGAQDMLQVVSMGSTEIRNMRQESNDLGETLDQLSADKLSAANDAIDRIVKSGSTAARTLGVELSDAVVYVAGLLERAIPIAADLAAKAWKVMADFALGAIQTLMEGVMKIWDVMSMLPGVIGETFGAMRDKLQGASNWLDGLQERLNITAEVTQQHRVNEEAAEAQHQANLTAVTLSETERRTQAQIKAEEKAAKERAKTEQWLNQTKISMAQQAWQYGVSFLQNFVGKNKVVALAVIAIQKGLAIAQIKIQTAVAQMRALAELGPIAGPPAAASIRALGAVSIGLVVASGLAEASQLGSSGADPGTPANPIHTQSSVSPGQGFSPGAGPAAQTPGSGVIINLYGNMYGQHATLEHFAWALKEAYNLDMVTIRTADGRAEVY